MIITQYILKNLSYKYIERVIESIEYKMVSEFIFEIFMM